MAKSGSQSGVTTTEIVRLLVPLNSIAKGVGARPNFTLLRMPAQPVAPLKAPDFTMWPF